MSRGDDSIAEEKVFQIRSEGQGFASAICTRKFAHQKIGIE
jgi:hypothetical protein